MAKQTKILSRGAYRVLEASGSDHLDLWELLWTVEAEEDLEDDPEAAREAGRRVVSELVKGGYIHAGVPKGRDDFIPWRLTADEAVELIEAGWKALGRDPNISEVAWFDITEKGKAHLAHSEGGAG